jgi:hypothetical protein
MLMYIDLSKLCIELERVFAENSDRLEVVAVNLSLLLRIESNGVKKRRHHMLSFAAVNSDSKSASVLDLATVFCFDALQSKEPPYS